MFCLIFFSLCLNVPVILGDTFCHFSDYHRLGNTESLLHEVSGIWVIGNTDLRFSTCCFSWPEQRLEGNVVFLLWPCRAVENIGLFELFCTVSWEKLAWGQCGQSLLRFKLLRSRKSFRMVICTLLIIEDLINDDWALTRLAEDAKASSWQDFRFLFGLQWYRKKDVTFHSTRTNKFFSTLSLKTASHFSCTWKHNTALFAGSVIHHL